MLDFEPSVISAVMSDFDPHAKGFIDYTDFCVNVMGSGPAPPRAPARRQRRHRHPPGNARRAGERASPSLMRSILTEIYLCHVCSG
eukprot:COSAG01_NODE_10586_length_2128_cov_1.787087_2_plen_86_part_00